MRRPWIAAMLICITTAVLAVTSMAADRIRIAPAFTGTDAEDWINSEPLTWQDLRGQVVLLEFWTFDCWNCYRSFPWLTAMEERLTDEDFTVIAIHSPEFAHEKKRANVVAKVREFDLHHPVMLDNDHSYWNAINNRYWPAWYLIDKQGRIRASYVGETHDGDKRAVSIEAGIRQLLQEEL